MPSNGTIPEAGSQRHIVLRDLQTLLCKSSLGEQVTVTDYTTTSLLPVGENYASTMLKVDAVIKCTKDSPEEQLPLVAKMIPTTAVLNCQFNNTASFAKEMFVFEKLVPLFRELEIEAGVSEEELIDILPKYYGGRLTRNEEKPDVADEDAAMIMENLKVRGYRTMSRMRGMDFDHAKRALKELARYHALGMAVKYKRPEFFEQSKPIINVFPLDLKDSEFDDVTTHMFKLICSDPRVAEYEERIKAAVSAANGWDSFNEIKAIEPWVSYTHGDFWVNNMMFRQAETGKAEDIKFVDFQIASMSSPLRDLPYFMCCSMSMEVVDGHFDELLDIYHTKFVEVLERTGCDASRFSKRSFEEQLKNDAGGELLRCLVAIKFFTLESPEDMDLNDMKSTVLLSDGNDLYTERTWKIISKYVEKDWI